MEARHSNHLAGSGSSPRAAAVHHPGFTRAWRQDTRSHALGERCGAHDQSDQLSASWWRNNGGFQRDTAVAQCSWGSQGREQAGIHRNRSRVRQAPTRKPVRAGVPDVRPVGHHSGRTRHQSRRSHSQRPQQQVERHNGASGIWVDRHCWTVFRRLAAKRSCRNGKFCAERHQGQDRGDFRKVWSAAAGSVHCECAAGRVDRDFNRQKHSTGPDSGAECDSHRPLGSRRQGRRRLFREGGKIVEGSRSVQSAQGGK